MGEETESDRSDDVKACSWCGAPLLGKEVERGRVCERCVCLLRSKGLADEEIFVKPGDQ